MDSARMGLGNEGAARALAARMPTGQVSVSPTQMVSGAPARDAWVVSYVSPDGEVAATFVYHGAGALRAFAEFGGPAASAEDAALAALGAALRGEEAA